MTQISDDELFKNNPKLENVKTSVKKANLNSPKTSEPETSFAEDENISCSFSESYWHFADSSLYTCHFKEPIEDSNKKIQESSKNKRIEGLSFVNSTNTKFLPQNLAKVSKKVVKR